MAKNKNKNIITARRDRETNYYVLRRGRVDVLVGDVKVSFQWENPDFLFKNPDFLIKNPDSSQKWLVLSYKLRLI